MAWVLIATDDFVHLNAALPRSMVTGSREAIERHKPLPASTLHRYRRWMTHERLTPILIAYPFVPEKFLKQFTALLREHAAVDIAAMI